MTDLQRQFTEFIPSETMKQFIGRKIDDGSYAPSAEDIAATVCQSDRDISEKAAFLKKLLDEELSEDTREQTAYFQKLYEKFSACSEAPCYAFECYDPCEKSEKTVVFNSLKRMLKFTRRHNIGWFRVIDKTLCGEYRYTAEFFADNGVVYDVYDLHDKMPENPISERYTAYPIPFETGDVVRYSKGRELYCVVNAEQPEYNASLNFVDASIMVIPYKYREYASPEAVRKHYENLKQPDYKPDPITVSHDHMMIIYAELHCKGEY